MDLRQAMDALKAVSLQDLDYELRKYEALKEWAIASLNIDYRKGDKVRIKEKVPCVGGWAGFEECLAVGSTGTVLRIDFIATSQKWFVDFQPETEWRVWHDGQRVRRIWNGPADECPEGMELRSPFEQKTYPNGKRHTFMFDPTWLELRRSNGGTQESV